MKKTLYLVLGLLLLAPAFAQSSVKRSIDSYEYVFAYTAQQTTGVDQWNITLYCVKLDLTTNTYGSVPAPTNFVLSPTSGPLAGYSQNWPTGQYQYTLYSLTYPGGPSGIIPGQVTPVSVDGIPVYQGFMPVSQL